MQILVRAQGAAVSGGLGGSVRGGGRPEGGVGEGEGAPGTGGLGGSVQGRGAAVSVSWAEGAWGEGGGGPSTCGISSLAISVKDRVRRQDRATSSRQAENWRHTSLPVLGSVLS